MCQDGLDLQLAARVSCVVAHAVKRFGWLDIAVNNAGTDGITGLIIEQTAETYADAFGLTRAAALRYAGDGIRVNALCPGATFGGMMSERHDPRR